MKIIVLVLSSLDKVYQDLEETIRDTWAINKNNNLNIFYYYGGSDSFFVDGDKIFCTKEESLFNIGYKTIEAFEYLYNNYEFDYIFRTNSSSYVNLDKMIDFLENKPKSSFYCGYINLQKNTNILFGSGSGYFLSKDLIGMILSKSDSWNHSLIDDVALGKFLSEHNVQLVQSKRLDINRLQDDLLYNFDRPILSDEIKNHFHFRCKTSDPNRLMDSLIMKNIHDALTGSDSQ